MSKLNPFRESSIGYKVLELVKAGTTREKFEAFCEKEGVGSARLFKNLKDSGYRNVAWKFIEHEDGSMKLVNVREVEIQSPAKKAKVSKKVEALKKSVKSSKKKVAEVKAKKSSGKKPAKVDHGAKDRKALPSKKIVVLDGDLKGKVFKSFFDLSKKTTKGDVTQVKVSAGGKVGYFTVTRTADGDQPQWSIEKSEAPE